MKKIIFTMLLLAGLTIGGMVGAADYGVGVYIDGERLVFDTEPEIINDRIMVPMRQIFERLGADVEWNQYNKSIKSGYENLSILMQINNRKMYVNDTEVILDSPPVIKYNRTLVPLRAVSEAFGAMVEWDDITDSVNITTYKTMYSDDGKSITVKSEDLSDMTDEGWSQQPTAAYCYEKIIDMKKDYPEGMRWTNDSYYEWDAGIYGGGFGCYGFAFILSDAAFGNLPARKIEGEVTVEMLRVGDILRINNDTHSVVVLEVHENHIVIAEGNYNDSIHWGRTLSKEEVESADYFLTRYPENG